MSLVAGAELPDTAPVPAGLDLGAYLARVGLAPAEVGAPTLATLQKVHGAHVQHIAFENLSQLGHLPVRLNLDALQRKLVCQRRGGYCYEHNLLLQAVLEALGFEVRSLAARVRWNRPAGSLPPRTHMLLQVEVDGQPHIADVGFGGLTLTAPLRLQPDLPQATPHGEFRVRETGGVLALEAHVGRHWTPLYDFDRQPQTAADHELVSWYLCHHPDSVFLNSLMAARPDAGGRHALANQRYAYRRLDGSSDKRTLTSVDELIEVLDQAFGVRVPDDAGLRTRLQQLLAG